MLYAFLEQRREEILKRANALVEKRSMPWPNRAELEFGLPMFISQLISHLRDESGLPARDQAAVPGIGVTATHHGGDLQRLGVSAAGVVNDYGAICSVITDMADELGEHVTAREFHALNHCLDVATADAIAEHAAAGERARADREVEHLGSLAHEMRNALSSVTFAVDAMIQGKVGPASRTAAVAQRGLLRLNELINRSLSEVRLAGPIDLRRERFLVVDVWNDIGLVLARAAEERAVKLEVDIDLDVGCYADKHLFISALFNIVHNAIKYTRTGTTVNARARKRDGGGIEIEVEDQCGGLPPGIADKLFEPFVQQTTDRSGLGLGLSIVRSIARAHGWDVGIRDLPGRGCMFTIRIPAAPLESEPSGAS